MRERHNLEKLRLPESSYEVWLLLQRSPNPVGRHHSPAQDLYEAWVEKRVERIVRRSGPARKRREGKKAAEPDGA